MINEVLFAYNNNKIYPTVYETDEFLFYLLFFSVQLHTHTCTIKRCTSCSSCTIKRWLLWWSIKKWDPFNKKGINNYSSGAIVNNDKVQMQAKI